jgi:nitroreductase
MDGEEQNMSFSELVAKTRSYHRFDQEQELSMETLRELVEYARHTMSGANLQPLRYLLINDRERNARVFAETKWAAYLSDWPGPVEGERPAAYILVLRDTEVKNLTAATDAGAALQSMKLGAMERGIGGCVIASMNKDHLREILAIPERYELLFLLALGVPVEQVVLEETAQEGEIRYYRDAQQVHHVPKRPLEELILES